MKANLSLFTKDGRLVLTRTVDLDESYTLPLGSSKRDNHDGSVTFKRIYVRNPGGPEREPTPEELDYAERVLLERAP